MVVLLFDIDGTLILTGGAGGDALMSAFADVFHVPDPQPVAFSGRTDRGIASSLFRAHGIDDTDANWHRMRDQYMQKLAAYLPQRVGRVLPGIESLLNQLSARDDFAVGLLTGNARESARMKLEHYRLLHHFRFGGYGDEHIDRDDVARAALAASRAFVADDLAPDQVWVIGDTPLDVQCARAVGARAAAVATGWHSREQLAEARPDLLLDSLEQADAFLQQVA